MRQSTHRGTIRHYAVIEEVDDGMGGTTTIREWVDYAVDVPLRHFPEGAGLEREEHGDRFRDGHSVLIPARYVGSLDTEGGYELDIGTGDNWRVIVPGLPGGSRRLSITNHRAIYGVSARNVPESVYIQVQPLTE